MAYAIAPTYDTRQKGMRRSYDQISNGSNYYPNPKRLRTLSQNLTTDDSKASHPWNKAQGLEQHGSLAWNKTQASHAAQFASPSTQSIHLPPPLQMRSITQPLSPGLAFNASQMISPYLSSPSSPESLFSPPTTPTMFCSPPSATSVICSTPSFFPPTCAPTFRHTSWDGRKTQAGLQPFAIPLNFTQTNHASYLHYIPQRQFSLNDGTQHFVKLPKLELDKRISHSKSLSEARRRFHEVDALHGADAYSFSRMMKRCITAKRCELAFEYFEEMCKRNVKANSVVFNVVIDACKETGDFERANKYFNQMQEKGIVANDRTFNSMINVCVKSGLLKEAMGLLDMMEKRFIKPNHRTFTSLINVCVKEGLLEAALKMKNEMITRHIRPDNRTYTSLINVCVKDGLLQNAKKIKEEMRACVDQKPDDRTYNSLINVCVKDGLVEEALKFKNEMFVEGVPWDELTFTSLISTCIKEGRIEDALKFKKEMLHCNIRPNARTFTASINVCVKNGLFEQAQKLRQEMVKRCVWPNERTYNAMINVCVKDGLTKEALQLAQEMGAKGMRITEQVHNALINVCVRDGKHDQAQKIKEDMALHGLTENKMTHEYFLSVLASAGMFDECKKYVDDHSDIFVMPATNDDMKEMIFDVNDHEAGFAFTLLLLNLPRGPVKLILGQETRCSRGLSTKPVLKRLIESHLKEYETIWAKDGSETSVQKKGKLSVEFSNMREVNY